MNTPSVVLEIKGIHVPAFKNSKMLARGKLITDPKKQRTMDEITQSFESQLRYAILTQDGGTSTGRSQRFWTALSQQFDDSRQWIPELHVYSRDCDKSEEGCTILIEEI